MEIKKIHEDERREIHSVKGLLSDNNEFTFILLKEGTAVGGCIHGVVE